MLAAHEIQARGRHDPLIEPTTFEVGRGEMILLEAPEQLTRTGLALALTGRMELDGGSLAWDGDTNRRALRHASEVLDSPGINEMEQQMRVRDYVREMLSYAPHRPFQRPKAADWLAENGLEDLDNLHEDQLSGNQRIRLVSALARAYTDADLLVFDTPSRHAVPAAVWLSELLALAEDDERPRAVVVILPEAEPAWNGARAVVGDPESWTDGDPSLPLISPNAHVPGPQNVPTASEQEL